MSADFETEDKTEIIKIVSTENFVLTKKLYKKRLLLYWPHKLPIDSCDITVGNLQEAI